MIAGLAPAMKPGVGNDFRSEPSCPDDRRENGRNCGAEIVSKGDVATISGGGIDAFAADIEGELPGDCIPVAEIMNLYATMRRAQHIRGPVVSTKNMVAALRARGWARVQMDFRNEGNGRPVCYVVPEREASMCSDEAA